MVTFSIAINKSETKIHINPPFNKPIKYIEVLECKASKEWITFGTKQKISVNDQSIPDLELHPGTYSLEYLEWALFQYREAFHLKISTDGVRFYIRSTKHDEVMLSRGLAESLDVTEILVKNRSYTIQRQPEMLLKVYCSLVEEHSSYENNILDWSKPIKITPSKLLSIIPIKNYPRLKASHPIPINYFTLSILDEYGDKINLNTRPIRIILKLSF